MWPRTSWSLSSFTLNMVFGRASVISPSISIFSSLPIGARVAQRSRGTRAPAPPVGGLATLERRVPRALLDEGRDRGLEVLAGEESAEDLGRDLVGRVDATAAIGAHDALGLPMGHRRAGGEAMGEPHGLLLQLVVGQDAVDDV